MSGFIAPSYTTEPVKLEPGQTAGERLVVVSDISAFWGKETPRWSVDAIADIMSWTDIATHSRVWSRLIVLSPFMSSPSYVTSSFSRAWKQWCSDQATSTRVHFLLNSGNVDDYTVGPAVSDSDVTVSFYPREYAPWDSTRLTREALKDFDIELDRSNDGIEIGAILARGCYVTHLSTIREVVTIGRGYGVPLRVNAYRLDVNYPATVTTVG